MTEEITNLIIALVPSIVGILGIVGSVLTCIMKVRSIANDSASEVKNLHRQLADSAAANIAIINSNAQLKDELKALEAAIAKLAADQSEILDKQISDAAEKSKQTAEMAVLLEELEKVKAQLASIAEE